MTEKLQLTTRIQSVLEKHQFHRSGLVWNRDCTQFVDVIDLQISKSGDMFTINAGVASKFIIRVCWKLDSSSVIDESSCTVRKRLGELLYLRDVWWSLADDNSIEEVLNGIQDAVIPFLQLNHSIDHMISTLENDLTSRRYPPGVVYLALLHYQKGEISRCKEMFEMMSLSGAWKQKASEILKSLLI